MTTLREDEAPSVEAQVLGYCGRCHHFEVWALGGGGDCHKGEDPVARSTTQTCPQRDTHAQGHGPQMDMSE